MIEVDKKWVLSPTPHCQVHYDDKPSYIMIEVDKKWVLSPTFHDHCVSLILIYIRVIQPHSEMGEMF